MSLKKSPEEDESKAPDFYNTVLRRFDKGPKIFRPQELEAPLSLEGNEADDEDGNNAGGGGLGNFLRPRGGIKPSRGLAVSGRETLRPQSFQITSRAILRRS